MKQLHLFVPASEVRLVNPPQGRWDPGKRGWSFDQLESPSLTLLGPGPEWDALPAFSRDAYIIGLEVPCQVCGRETRMIQVVYSRASLVTRDPARLCVAVIGDCGDPLAWVMDHMGLLSDVRPLETPTGSLINVHSDPCAHCRAVQPRGYLADRCLRVMDNVCFPRMGVREKIDAEGVETIFLEAALGELMPDGRPGFFQ